MGLLDGRVAIVTGAAQGMGEREAERFVAEGARVVLTDVQEEKGHAVAKSLGDAACFVRHDVSQESDWDAVIATALERFDALHVLVNNAAIQHVNTIEEDTLEDLERVLRINLIGTWWGIKKAIAPMKQAGRGSIVNKSSLAGTRGIPTYGAYGAAKWGVRGLTKVAAHELGPYGIRVNSVHPGPIEETSMFTMPEDEAGRRRMIGPIPLKRAGSRDDIAGVVLFLASDLSAYVTGHEHVVDGGRSIW